MCQGQGKLVDVQKPCCLSQIEVNRVAYLKWCFHKHKTEMFLTVLGSARHDPTEQPDRPNGSKAQFGEMPLLDWNLQGFIDVRAEAVRKMLSSFLISCHRQNLWRGME